MPSSKRNLVLQVLLNASRHCHYFALNLGKMYRMDVRPSQDASIDNTATLTSYTSWKNTSTH